MGNGWLKIRLDWVPNDFCVVLGLPTSLSEAEARN